MLASSTNLPVTCQNCPYLNQYAPYMADTNMPYMEPEVEEYDENGKVERVQDEYSYRQPPFIPGPFFGPGPFFPPGPFYPPRPFFPGPFYGPRPFFGGGFGLPFLTGLALGGLLF